MNRPDTRTALLLCLLALMLLFSACGSRGDEAAPSEQSETAATEASEVTATATSSAESIPTESASTESTPEQAPIQFGVLAPLSAPGAVAAGLSMVDAMTIAVDELNDRGGILGRSVELIVEDSTGQPDTAVEVLKGMLEQASPVAITGIYHSSVAMAVKDLAHEQGVPILFTEPWADEVTVGQLPEVFRITPLTSEATAVDHTFITNLPYEVDTVAIVVEDTDFGIPAMESVSVSLADAGIGVEIFKVDIGTIDFADIIEQIHAIEPDFVISLVTGETFYNYLSQAAGAGVGPQNVPTLCNQAALDSVAYWINVPEGNYCFIRRAGVPVSLLNDVALSFQERYAERTGKTTAETYAFSSYDSIMLLALAIEEAGMTDAASLIDALEKIAYQGAIGEITFPVNSRNPPLAAGVDEKWWHQFPEPAITVIQYQEAGQDASQAVVVYPEDYTTGEIVWVTEE